MAGNTTNQLLNWLIEQQTNHQELFASMTHWIHILYTPIFKSKSRTAASNCRLRLGQVVQGQSNWISTLHCEQLQRLLHGLPRLHRELGFKMGKGWEVATQNALRTLTDCFLGWRFFFTCYQGNLGGLFAQSLQGLHHLARWMLWQEFAGQDQLAFWTDAQNAHWRSKSLALLGNVHRVLSRCWPKQIYHSNRASVRSTNVEQSSALAC